MEQEPNSNNENSDSKLEDKTSSEQSKRTINSYHKTKVNSKETTQSENVTQSGTVTSLDENTYSHNKNTISRSQLIDTFSMEKESNVKNDIHYLKAKYTKCNSESSVLTLTSETYINQSFRGESVSNRSEGEIELKNILEFRAEQSALKMSRSKDSIQQRDSVKKRLDEEAKIRSTLTAQLLMTQGSQVKHLHKIVEALRSDEEVEFVKENKREEILGCYPCEIGFLVHNLGTEILRKQHLIELTSEQEDKLKELKQKTKVNNENYLKKHQQLGVLLSLVYKQLFKHLPNNPVHFVADYVHYLNVHREEMVLEPDITVPFDKILMPKTDVSLSQGREQVTRFVRKLITQCADIAFKGMSYFSATSIIESLLRNVSPSEDNIRFLGDSITSATDIVSEILMSLMTSVVEIKTEDKELIIAHILEAILENICPSVRTDSDTYFEIFENVEEFVNGMVTNLVVKATEQIEHSNSVTKSPVGSVE